MEIPNLSPQTVSTTPPLPPRYNLKYIVLILVLAVGSGFWLSRFFPNNSSSSVSDNSPATSAALSTDKISDAGQLQVGKVYGNLEKAFKDTATGVVEKGSINGEGTHILNREGGVTQRASLISSAVDLDLFVGKKVDIKGETNSSSKTAWLLDVGSIKIIE